MKVLLISNYENSRQGSMQKFSDLLYRGLVEAGCDARMIHPMTVIGRLKQSENGLGKWLGYFDRFVFFRLQLRRLSLWADVVHICDQANAVYVPWLKGKPNVVTCHDMLAIRSALGEISENPTRWTGRVFQRWILSGLRLSQRVVCVSEQTCVDVLCHVNLPSERVVVVPNALNYPYCPMVPGEAVERLHAIELLSERPFFLHVGGNEWYKNRSGVLRIFHYLVKQPCYRQHCMVMVGKPLTGKMQNYIEEMGLEKRIKVLAGISNEDLRALYSMAEALIFPSLQEGFGWPIIEAQACGCLVVTTNRAPMTEVGGDAAVYIDPADEISAAGAITERLKDSHALRKAGFLNAARFSNNVMISGYLKAYETVCMPATR